MWNDTEARPPGNASDRSGRPILTPTSCTGHRLGQATTPFDCSKMNRNLSVAFDLPLAAGQLDGTKSITTMMSCSVSQSSTMPSTDFVASLGTCTRGGGRMGATGMKNLVNDGPTYCDSHERGNWWSMHVLAEPHLH